MKVTETLKSEKGFTLVELIVVIVILGILSTVIAPSMLKYIHNARKTAALNNAGLAYSHADLLLKEKAARENISDLTEITQQEIEQSIGTVINGTVVCEVENKEITKFEYTDEVINTTFKWDFENLKWIIIQN